MQPLLKQMTYGPVMGWPLSTITRVPGWIDMPSGKVTRSTFFGSFSGSIRTAATTGMPDSTRPSLPVKQTCLAFASWPFRQNFVQGEKVSCGCSACACGCCGACGAGISAGLGAGAAFGAALGAAGAAGAGLAGGAWAKAAELINAVSMVVAAAMASAHAAGRAG